MTQPPPDEPQTGPPTEPHPPAQPDPALHDPHPTRPEAIPTVGTPRAASPNDPPHRLRFAARTDRGLLRSNNQDSVYAGERLLIVADGMGGHAAGDLASRVVVAAFAPLDEQPPGHDLMAPLRQAMDAGNDAIADLVAQDPDLDGMGTTATAMLFDGPRMGMAHIGDSRAYLYRNGVLRQLSHDDTFVQSLVDDNRITEEEAAHHPQRNLLLRALNGSEPEPMLAMREISVGDRFLLCSDGLSGVVSAEAIADTLAGADPDRVADTLIELALIGGGPDNVTVIVADVLDVGPELLTIPPGYDPDDPEATGPILPIHMTQRMPRVPLPVLSDEEAAERAEAQRAAEAALAAESDEDSDDEDVPAPPEKSRWRGRTLMVVAVVAVLGLLVAGSIAWVRTQYYVGEHNGEVVVFRGVDGSIFGIDLATVEENSCSGNQTGCVPLRTADLVQAARDQVAAGITATGLDDARIVIVRLSGQLLPLCDPPPPTTTPTTPPTTPPTTTPPTTTSSGGTTTTGTTTTGTTTTGLTTPGSRTTATSRTTPTTGTTASAARSASPTDSGFLGLFTSPLVPMPTAATGPATSTSGAVTPPASTPAVSPTTIPSPTPTPTPTPIAPQTATQIPGVTCR